jgi:hypothetical protein
VCGFYDSEVAVSVTRKCGKPFRVSRRIPLASLFEIKKKKGRKEERRKEKSRVYSRKCQLLRLYVMSGR